MNVNGDIVSTPGAASYAVYASAGSGSQGAGATETPSSADSVEISAVGRAASLGAFEDRFRFDIANGFLSVRDPRRAGVVNPGSAAAATYSARGQTRALVQGGAQSAIFALRYGDDVPGGPANGVANRRAIVEFKRIVSQNLSLLSVVG